MISQMMLSVDTLWAIFATTCIAGVGFTTGQSAMRSLVERLRR